MLHARKPEPLIRSSDFDMPPPHLFNDCIGPDVPLRAFLSTTDGIDQAGKPAQHIEQLVWDFIADVEPDDDVPGSTIVGKGFNGGIGKAEDGCTPH